MSLTSSGQSGCFSRSCGREFPPRLIEIAGRISFPLMYLQDNVPCICWLLVRSHSQLLETTHFIGSLPSPSSKTAVWHPILFKFPLFLYVSGFLLFSYAHSFKAEEQLPVISEVASVHLSTSSPAWNREEPTLFWSPPCTDLTKWTQTKHLSLWVSSYLTCQI